MPQYLNVNIKHISITFVCHFIIPRRKAWGYGDGRRGSVRPDVPPSVTFFCAQLLLQFLCDLNQTFTEWLSSRGGAHIVSILRFHYLSRSYYLFCLNLLCAQPLLQFWCNLNQTFTEWLSPSAAAHIVSNLWFYYLSRSYCPLFKLLCATPPTVLVGFL